MELYCTEDFIYIYILKCPRSEEVGVDEWLKQTQDFHPGLRCACPVSRKHQQCPRSFPKPNQVVLVPKLNQVLFVPITN